MNKLLILFVAVLFAACTSPVDKRISYYDYINSADTLSVWQHEQDDQPMETRNSVIIGKDPDTERFYSMGQFSDQFREGRWAYRKTPAQKAYFNWTTQQFDMLSIKANLFTNDVSYLMDDHTAAVSYPFNGDSVTVQLFSDTNSSMLIKRMPYDAVIRMNMEEKKFVLSQSSNSILQDSSHTINIVSMTFTDAADTSFKVHYKTAYANLGTGYLAFAVRSVNNNLFEGSVLFDGILTNIFLNKERFYNPFRKRNKSLWVGTTGQLPSANEDGTSGN